MKFFFNAWTDEARDACDQAGIPWRRVERGIDIYTENFDLAEDDFRERDIVPLDPDRPRQYRTQGVRVWKHPDTKNYYYLIKDVVFFKYDKTTVERNPSATTGESYDTTFVVAIFDVVPEDEQGRYRDILLSRPPMAEGRLM